MSDQEQQLLKEASRGAMAKGVIENEVYREAMSIVESDILEKWKASPIRDTEGQLALRLKWQCLQEIKGYIKDVMETGKLAETVLEENRTLAQRARAALHQLRR